MACPTTDNQILWRCPVCHNEYYVGGNCLLGVRWPIERHNGKTQCAFCIVENDVQASLNDIGEGNANLYD